ncbi:hypothetical protein F5144DRAFT_587694 [Chaetomium tenue]|uniref:Uncharacterized protein n=1 Tax=Chaetomium tenue TaxID=1854479 RepID=A0ACB7NVQ9_9PEZI|nr:hypothetical protein F5144DRAFT_587694 [Chaetomium globosum]
MRLSVCRCLCVCVCVCVCGSCVCVSHTESGPALDFAAPKTPPYPLTSEKRSPRARGGGGVVQNLSCHVKEDRPPAQFVAPTRKVGAPSPDFISCFLRSPLAGAVPAGGGETKEKNLLLLGGG